MARYPGVSMSVTRRLPRYYRCLGDLLKKGVERISSREFAQIIGFTASQIRQDLNCFGGFGQQGYGYNVDALQKEIGKILAIDRGYPIILIGAGNLGVALVNHLIFEQDGFKLLGIFDNNPKIIGQHIRDWTVEDISQIEAFCKLHNPTAAILCIPESAVAEIADELIALGIQGFWNFSHYDMSVNIKADVAVESVHLGDSLMTLAYLVSEILEK